MRSYGIHYVVYWVSMQGRTACGIGQQWRRPDQVAAGETDWVNTLRLLL